MKKIDSDSEELVSALVDGELSPSELSCALKTVQSSPSSRANWDAYHVIGEVLRTQSVAVSATADIEFSTRFRERLLQEKAIEKAARDRAHLISSLNLTKNGPPQDSANDAVFRWKMVAGFASVMAVAVMGWHWAAGGNVAATSQQWASAEPTRQPVMIRDPRLDRLLAAHQQNSGVSGAHLSNGFLRNATYTPSEP